jgi:ribonuclease H / adenosylcobalamin/alpha-ribazole phosphatase
VGGVHLLGSEALGDATNNVAEYTAVRNALRAAADAGATSAHVRMDSPVVFGHLSGASRARAEHLIQLKEEVEAQVARYPGRVTFTRIPWGAERRRGRAREGRRPGFEGAERRSAAIGPRADRKRAPALDLSESQSTDRIWRVPAGRAVEPPVRPMSLRRPSRLYP